MTPYALDLIAAARDHWSPCETLFDSIGKAMIVEALRRTRGEQKAAARILMVSPKKLNYMMARFRMRPCDEIAEVA